MPKLYVNLQMRVDEQTYRDLDSAAKEYGLSVPKFVLQCALEEIIRREEQKEKKTK